MLLDGGRLVELDCIAVPIRRQNNDRIGILIGITINCGLNLRLGLLLVLDWPLRRCWNRDSAVGRRDLIT